jgi:hypothetical protein
MTNTALTPLSPPMPFVWPAPLVSAGFSQYSSALPFEAVARTALSVFGVVSAIDKQAVDWMEGFLSDNSKTQLRMVISIHPTCRTTEVDLQNLLRLVERHGGRADYRVFPEVSLRDRSSNLLCLIGADGQTAISVGPTENMGFARASPSQANLVTAVTAATFEACRKWFDYLWGVAGPLQPELVTTMPHLVLPKGEQEAAQLWEDYREQCLSPNAEHAVQAVLNPETGEVALVDGSNCPAPSPTEAMGVPKLDLLSDALGRIFDLGALVAMDKLSRIPPLKAPVKPEWFGVDSFRQTGMIKAQTSIKVSPFDETTIKKIEHLLGVSGELLPRFSFALADGVRWMPQKAMPLFEAALSVANDEAKQLLGMTMGDDIASFLTTQRERIRADAQRMYEGYHPGGKIPESAVDNIIDELKLRLGKTQSNKLIPTVAYSPIAFNPAQKSEWSSPWGQAFALLKGVAEFPRAAMTNRFFWSRLRTSEEALIHAMDVAGDHLVPEYGSRNAMKRAAKELILIKELEDSPGEPLDKCRALWELITTGREAALMKVLREAPNHNINLPGSPT